MDDDDDDDVYSILIRNICAHSFTHKYQSIHRIPAAKYTSFEELWRKKLVGCTKGCEFQTISNQTNIKRTKIAFHFFPASSSFGRVCVFIHLFVDISTLPHCFVIPWLFGNHCKQLKWTKIHFEMCLNILWEKTARSTLSNVALSQHSHTHILQKKKKKKSN